MYYTVGVTDSCLSVNVFDQLAFHLGVPEPDTAEEHGEGVPDEGLHGPRLLEDGDAGNRLIGDSQAFDEVATDVFAGGRASECDGDHGVESEPDGAEFGEVLSFLNTTKEEWQA